MMSKDTEDTPMTDVHDKGGEAETPRLPKRPLPPRPPGHETPQETKCSTCNGELENQLSEAREGIKDVERKYNQARDLSDNIQVAYTVSQKESNELKEKVKTLQNESAELKKKCNALRSEQNVIHERETARLLDIVEGRRKQADANTHIALLRVQELSEELQKCKDELFDLQPPNPVADTHISAEWEALCSSITTWIDDHSGGIEDLRVQLQELRAKKELSKALEKYWGEDRQLIANHYSRSSHILDELVRYNIHCFLEAKVFNDRVYMVGLSPSEAKLLLTIERKMADLEPRRGKKPSSLRPYSQSASPTSSHHELTIRKLDPSKIGLWRSEALTALSSGASFHTLLDKQAQKITDEASEILEPLLQRRARGAMSAFHHDITMPAIRLASTLRQSTATYRFVFHVASDKFDENRPPLRKPGNRLLLYKTDLETMDVLDVRSRITLKKGRNYEEASDGSIADSILVVHPALYRESAATGKSVLVSRQLLLADLFKPPQRRGQVKDVEGSRGLFDKLSFNFAT